MNPTPLLGMLLENKVAKTTHSQVLKNDRHLGGSCIQSKETEGKPLSSISRGSSGACAFTKAPAPTCC